MRIPFGSNPFENGFNFFTSFGYFKNYSEHNNVIGNMSRFLKDGGKLVIDYLNVNVAESNLKPYETKEIDRIVLSIKRWMDEEFFYKKIQFEVEGVDDPFEYTEQVAKFSLIEFNDFFLLNNLKLEEIYGDYGVGEYLTLKSPRLIMIA